MCRERAVQFFNKNDRYRDYIDLYEGLMNKKNKTDEYSFLNLTRYKYPGWTGNIYRFITSFCAKRAWCDDSMSQGGEAKGIDTNLQLLENHRILQVKTLNIQKTNIIEELEPLP